MPDRSEAPLRDYLDLCDTAGVRATFFFIGWYAEKFPERLREVIARGHEVGCHSLMHEDLAELTDDAFRSTTAEAKDRIEQAIGQSILSYRAPSFSMPPARAAGLLAALYDLGFTIDSSITTAARIHGGGHARQQFSGPANLKATFGVDIVEIPVPGVRMAGRELAIFGGGYLRMTPRFVLNRLARRETYQVLYLHPHDFDLNLPPLPQGSAITQLRRTIHVGDIHAKVLDLFAACTVKTCGEVAQELRK